MLTMIWKHEDGRRPYLEFPIKIDRENKNIKVKDLDLDSATIWHIRKTLNKWGSISQLTMWEELTINDILDFLEKGIKYKGEFYISYKKTLEAASHAGLIPDITIGTLLIDVRFKRIPVEYVEDLPRLISVWEKYHRHPELIGVAKEIISNQ